jgi:BirA family biotin operon repressor/biotin-[acetyl-CoA-carboxylase] ligase
VVSPSNHAAVSGEPESSTSELILPAAVVGTPVQYREHTTSTMDDARAAAEAGAPPGAVYVAGEQTAGRGRQGRTWLSAASAGLYATYHLRTPQAASAQLYSLAGGLAASDAILEAAHLPTVLKWPNDVQHVPSGDPEGARKLCGVLAESRPAPGGRLDVFLGVGINVRAAALPPEVAALATSIEAAGATPPALEQLLAALSDALARWSALLEASPPALVEAWRARLVTLGQRVRLATPAGPVEGNAVDVSPLGELVLRLADGRTQSFAAGDVTTLRGAS